MSHATMAPDTAQEYKTQLESEQLWGYFENQGTTRWNSSYTFTQRCLVVDENEDSYFVRYYDQDEQTFTHAWIEKNKVTLNRDVEEQAYWVVRNKATGRYYSSSSNPSSCPSIYSTKGKAEAAMKRVGKNFEVKKWVISERDA